MNRRWVIFACVLGVLAAAYGVWGLLVALAGNQLPLQLPWLLLTGWWGVLRNLLTGLRGTWPLLMFVVLVIGAFTAGFHYFLRWSVATTVDGPRRWRRRWSLACSAGVVLLFTAGLLSWGIAVQIVWWNTTTQRRITTTFERYPFLVSSAIEQTADGVVKHVEATDSLPSGYTISPSGELLHGWMTQLLPYIEQRDARGVLLQDRVKWDLPWHHERNRRVFQTPVPAFQPGYYEQDGSKRDERGYELTELAANVNLVEGNLPMAAQREIRSRAYTIFAGEAYTNRVPWGYAANWRDPAIGINTSVDGFSAPWEARGVQFLMLDGAVQFIREDIDPIVLRALAWGDEREAAP